MINCWRQANPLGKMSSLTIDGDAPICARVFRLITTWYPFAVFKIIWAVVIDTFNGMACWFGAHIVKKVFKLEPTFTNPNSPASIMTIGWRIRVGTAS